MHEWDLSLGGLNDKRMRENLRGRVRVASTQKNKRLGQGALLVERSVGLGQGKKILDLPEEMPGKGEKKGEGERGLGRALPFLSLCTLES